jgi:hypothetical protein
MTLAEYPWEHVSFPTHTDERGSLTMAQSGPVGLVPFEIKRTYWLHDIKDLGKRGEHATFNGRQLMIPLSGGFAIKVSDGVTWRTFNLQAGLSTRNGQTDGILIKPGTWRELFNFLPGTVVLILADTLYEDVDYCRNWADFLDRVKIDGAPRRG